MSCIFPNCNSNAAPGLDMCIGHNKTFGKPKEAKVIKPIAKKSAKRIKDDKVLSAKLKEIKDRGGKCEAKTVVCTGRPQGFHHVQKTSPKNRLLEGNIIPCCNACNLWIEENPIEAEGLGLTVSRFTT